MADAKSALTADEWAERRAGEPHKEGSVFIESHRGREILAVEGGGTFYEIANRKGAAALALHDQPFGFTREDVDLLDRLADGPDDERLAVEALRDRIEALLPPEE